MSTPSLLALLARTAALCDGCDVPYMVMGGIAVAVHAIPRPTLDVDLTVDADDERLQRLLRAAMDDGFVVPERHLAGFTDTLKGMGKLQLTAFVEDLEHDVDLFLVTTEYQRAAFERRREADLGARRYWVIAPEDLVLHKLLTGRGRDESDVDDVLFLQGGTLDLAHLREWAERLDVLPVLERKLRTVRGEESPS